MRIELPSGTTAVLSRPTSSRQGGSDIGLVIAPDIFGLRPLYDDLVARLAADWNMVVCAAEPFPGHDLGPEIEARFASVAQLVDAEQIADLELAAEATECEQVGLLGFCMGGMYCHKAAVSDRFDRIVSFYGMIRVPEAWRSPGQDEPLAALAAGHADRVMAIIGEQDHYTPPEDVAALAAAGVTVVSYPGAEHGFAHDADRPAHRPADAADAFTRAKAWLLG